MLTQVRVGDEQRAQMARLPPAGAWEDWNRGGRPGRWNFAKRRMHANEESTLDVACGSYPGANAGGLTLRWGVRKDTWKTMSLDEAHRFWPWG